MRRRLVHAIASLLAGAAFLVVSGCASRNELPSRGGHEAINPPHSERGNPPFYEVLGKRYYVLASSKGYDERGIASWYGPQFHKHATSSGEIYDMYAMTAASKTLPLPTWVEVTNLENGNHVIVKVNDRGPFVKHRLIDLSYAAAKALGMLRAGTARVEVRALGAPHDVPAAPPVTAAALPVPSAAGAAASELFIQVGAFSEHRNAVKVARRLRKHGYSKVFVLPDGGDGFNRVRIGPLDGVQEFDRVQDGLRDLGMSNASLVTGG